MPVGIGTPQASQPIPLRSRVATQKRHTLCIFAQEVGQSGRGTAYRMGPNLTTKEGLFPPDTCGTGSFPVDGEGQDGVRGYGTTAHGPHSFDYAHLCLRHWRRQDRPGPLPVEP